jgi:hypothetical protein
MAAAHPADATGLPARHAPGPVHFFNVAVFSPSSDVHTTRTVASSD